MMNRKERAALLTELEEHRSSRVLTYVLSDRPGPSAVIGKDAVRPLYEHLRDMTDGHKHRLKRLDLFLYSIGGDVSVPWRIVSMIRECADEFNVLVPYKAHSAATMIALGADRILMGPKAELGPIDPSLRRAVAGESASPPQQIGVEDVSSYVAFMKDRAGITDQTALASVMRILANQIGPVSLGNANREYSHIRLVAQKLLSSRRSKMEDQTISLVVDALTEKMYSHGHGIGRTEAKEIGLPVQNPPPDVGELMWQLFAQYESRLLLNEPLDAELELDKAGTDEHRIPDVVIAAIESTGRCHLFSQELRLARRRQLPVQATINIQVAVPPGQVSQQQMQQLVQNVGQIVRQQLIQQAPVTGIEAKLVGGRWRDETAEEV